MIASNIPMFNTTSIDPAPYYREDIGHPFIEESTPLYRYNNILEQTSDKDFQFITDLKNYSLKKKIPIIIEKDEDEYLAESLDFPLFGCGETKEEAIEHLKDEILSLYEDLMSDDNFSEEFLQYKKFLKSIVT